MVRSSWSWCGCDGCGDVGCTVKWCWIFGERLVVDGMSKLNRTTSFRLLIFLSGLPLACSAPRQLGEWLNHQITKKSRGVKDKKKDGEKEMNLFYSLGF